MPVQRSTIRAISSSVTLSRRRAPSLSFWISRSCSYSKEIFVVAGKQLRQGILVFVNVLKFVYHDVFQSLLPLFQHFPAAVQNMQGKIDQVVKIQSEALALLIKIPVEDLIL